MWEFPGGSLVRTHHFHCPGSILQFSSAQSLSLTLCLTLCDPMDCSTPGFPVHHQPPELAQLMSTELVMPSNHLILCHLLLFLPSIFPSIRVFSNESVLHIRWPGISYWNIIVILWWCLMLLIFHFLEVLSCCLCIWSSSPYSSLY